MGGQLVGIVSGREPELLAPLNLWGARTHDWALINAGQRICDTHFVFPLFHLDPSDPSNYFFGPSDEILDRTVNLLGLNVLFRMGRMDLVVNGNIIIELKAINHIDTPHRRQLWNYMNLTHLPYGMLINFSPDGLYSEWYHRNESTGNIDKIKLL